MATAQDVPSGTISDITAWMGSDPDRARAVLETESAMPSPRSTLIAAAERVVNQPQAPQEQQPMAEEAATTTNGEEEPTWDDLYPHPEPVTSVAPGPGTVAGPVELVGSAEEVDVGAVDVTTFDDEGNAEAVEGEPVTSFQVVANSGGAILAINGTAYALSPGAVATLLRVTDRLTATVSL